MTGRFRPDKTKSQIVFDITGGETEFATMNLRTIPNREKHIRPVEQNFSLRTDDIEGAQYTPMRVRQSRPIMDITDIEGTQTKPMVDHSKPAVDILSVDDIDGAKPRIQRQLPHSKRMTNPIDPHYDLPSYQEEPPVIPPFIRNTLTNDDIEGSHPTIRKFDKPPRDIMDVSDIVGARPTHQVKCISNGKDMRLDVSDINNDRVFKSKRITDPLNPVYHVYGEDLTGDDFGFVAPPKPGRKEDFQFNTQDIEGAQHGSSSKWYRTFRAPPEPKEDDDYDQPAPILMTKTMEKQTEELEAQKAAREYRGQKMRYYENRNLHVEKGTGDPIQAILRQQREAKQRVVPTFS